jgi:hypothetical protein
VQGIYRTAGVGAFVSVKDETALTTLDVSPLTLGTFAYVISEGLYFQLVLDGSNDLIWQQVAFGGNSIEPATGPNLTDADATVNPASSAISASVLPASTLTGNRVLTIGVSGSPTTQQIYQVIRRDVSAHTYTVKDDAGTTLFTFAASPSAPQGATFYFDGTHYVFLSFYYVD